MVFMYTLARRYIEKSPPASFLDGGHSFTTTASTRAEAPLMPQHSPDLHMKGRLAPSWEASTQMLSHIEIHPISVLELLFSSFGSYEQHQDGQYPSRNISLSASSLLPGCDWQFWLLFDKIPLLAVCSLASQIWLAGETLSKIASNVRASFNHFLALWLSLVQFCPFVILWQNFRWKL